MSITVKHVAKFSSFLEKLVCYRNTLPESWFYSAKWIIINSTLLCDNGYNHLPISLEISLSSHHLISFICPVSFSGGAEGGCYSEILELLWEGRKFWWGGWGGASFFKSQELSIESRERLPTLVRPIRKKWLLPFKGRIWRCSWLWWTVLTLSFFHFLFPLLSVYWGYQKYFC